MGYCKDCKNRVPYIPELDGYRRTDDSEPDNGRNICSYGMRIIKNAIGEDRYQLYGGMERCLKCGTILHDHRTIRYRKCEEININHKCKNFIELSIWEKIVNNVKIKIRYIADYLKSLRKYRIALFAIWAVFHCMVITQGEINRLYIGLTVLFFIFYITDNS